MSTIWTPSGEQPIGRHGAPAHQGPEQEPASRTPAGFGEASPGGPAEMTEEEQFAHMEQLREQLSSTPASVVVANHCFGLFELAALHLSGQPPQLSEAQLAIDALAALVENLTGRMGDAEEQLREGLSQLRLAFVQISQNATPVGQ